MRISQCMFTLQVVVTSLGLCKLHEDGTQIDIQFSFSFITSMILILFVLSKILNYIPI